MILDQTLFKAITAFKCKHCKTIFGVNTQKDECNCPNCLNKCKSLSEGFMVYNEAIQLPSEAHIVPDSDELLTAEDVAKILGKSKRVAYELMDRNDFPLIKIRRSKRVLKSDFFDWLRQNKSKV